MHESIRRIRSLTIFHDERAVSEILGDVLILLMTVVLFVSVFAFVWSMPAPNEGTYADFETSLDLSSGSGRIDITHISGETLRGEYTKIYIFRNGNEDIRILDTQGNDADNPLPDGYGLIGDPNWDPGETWTYHMLGLTENDTLEVAIYDEQHNNVVLKNRLLGGGINAPPIIMERDYRPNPAGNMSTLTIYANVFHPKGRNEIESVYTNVSVLNGSLGTISMTDIDNDGTFQATFEVDTDLGSYTLTIAAQDKSGNIDRGRLSVLIVDLSLANPDLTVEDEDITFTNPSPVRGSIITISAVVTNLGAAPGTALVKLYDGNKLIGTDNISVSAGGESTSQVAWHASPGGEHTIRTVIEEVNPLDSNPMNNEQEVNITVLPALLLVDDDLAPNDGGMTDSAGHLAHALESGGFSFDIHDTQVDGPLLHIGGPHPLQGYDVVVWTTGFDAMQPLTNSDRNELDAFLADGGKLWLAGEGLLHDPQTVAWPSLGVDSVDVPDISPMDLISGSPGHPVTNGWMLSTDLGERVSTVDTLIPVVTSLPMYRDNESGKVNGISREDLGADSRLILTTWDLVNLAYRNDQVEVVYRTILWLGALPGFTGEDVAISDVIIVPSSPQYRDPVRLNAIVRNNGATNQTVDVAFVIDEEEVTRKNVTVEAHGGNAVVEAIWVASSLGSHNVRIMVDPDNILPEINEENNVADGRTIQTSIVVTYRLLLVDDDESTNNGGTLANTSSQINDALESLGYSFSYYTVNASDAGPASGILGLYNAVIWVLGEASDSTLTNDDQANLTYFLGPSRGLLWILGENFLTDPGLDPGFVDSILHVQNVTDDVAISNPLNGVLRDPITHGMELATSGRLSQTIIPKSDAHSILQGANDKVFALRNEDEANGSKLVLFSFIPDALLGGAFGMGPPDGDSAVAELTYMILNWFDQPDPRIELRATRADISVSDDHPVIGKSFVLRARVFNVGGTASGFLVRFMDSETQIGSDTVALGPNENVSIEVIWTPLFAGSRTITVKLDPVEEVPEIFEFNNNPLINIGVYFFWDDMENGTDQWEHLATIVRINGEGPLEYLSGYNNIFTNVNDTWDPDMTEGVLTTPMEYHSFNLSYWLSEPAGGIPDPVDVVLTIDSSGSMNDDGWDPVIGDYQPIGDAKIAAKDFVDTLQEGDMAALYDFDSSVTRLQDFTTDKNIVKNAIDSLVAGGWTELYDTTIESVLYAAANSNNIRVVIILTDGQDTASESSLADAQQCVSDHNETGPDPLVYVFTIGLGTGVNQNVLQSLATKPSYYYYAPSSSDLDEIYNEIMEEIGSIRGGAQTRSISHPGGGVGARSLAFEDDLESGDWSSPGYPGSWSSSGNSVITASGGPHGGNYHLRLRGGNGVASHTVDLSGNTGGNLRFWRKAYSFETGDDAFLDLYYGGSWYNGVRTWVNGQDDNLYHLEDVTLSQAMMTSDFAIRFRSSMSSTADYLYIDDLTIDVTPEGGGGGGGGESGPSAIPGNKTATTFPLDLSGAEEALLSFWHKYNILPGRNGVFIEVGYRLTPGGPWLWNYSMPKQPYSGNLFLDIERYDDFGNPILWAWNGLSGIGTFTWEKVEVDILRFVPSAYRNEVRIRFNYTTYGGGTGYGYYLDDVEVTIRSGSLDYWSLTESEAFSATHSWWNVDSQTGALPEGADNSLITNPIDLTNAREARLEAVFKFNINEEPGLPPDGFRVEVSSDNGETWRPINLGVRSAWGTAGSDNTPPSSYTGHDLGNGWTSADTLSRLNVDLTGWIGSQIRIRFRMVTTVSDAYSPPYQHYLGGFFVDDVRVTGLSLAG